MPLLKWFEKEKEYKSELFKPWRFPLATRFIKKATGQLEKYFSFK